MLDKNTLFEKKFIKEVKGYVDAYKLLIESDKKEEAYSYALCFYASLFGIGNNLEEDYRDITTKTFTLIPIDDTICADLYRYIVDGEEDTQSSSVRYCYGKASRMPKISRNGAQKLMDMHSIIFFAQADKEIANTKKLHKCGIAL